MTDRNETAPAPAEIIPASRELGEKSLQPGNASLAALQAISSAEAALDELSVNFDGWMREEVDRLTAARADLKANGPRHGGLEALFEASHDLKGQAATLGYPLAADVCASLCRLLDAFADGGEIPLNMVDHHVDAVRAMVREGASGVDNETASTLAERLNLVTLGLVAGAAKPDSGSRAA